MVYPFDINTGSELTDYAITKNGFMLDMANSKYLNIDVKHSVLTSSTDGQLVEDVRFNRPAKDGEEYTDEGIYTFTVSNQYTGATTTKTIYVGVDSYLSALSNYEYTVEELNTILSQGATVSDDGEIIATMEQTESLLENENESESESETEIDTNADYASEETLTNTTEPNENTENMMESKSSNSLPDYLIIAVIILLILVIALICIAVLFKKRRSVHNNVLEEEIR